MTPNDVEIRHVAKDDIYDLFVNGRFKNFFKTFSEAAIEAERLIGEKVNVIEQWKRSPKKGGKVRA